MTAYATPEPRPARRIGPYDVLYELGRGGMGVVYRAVRIDGGPQVAVKMPSQDMADLFGSMRREIHALSRLDHPGVVRIIEEGVHKGVPWYAMELLDSRPLDVLLNICDDDAMFCSDADVTASILPFEPGAVPLPVPGTLAQLPEVRSDLRRALTLMYRLARVLAYVHAHGIVHRDLKPQNVLVRAGDRPVLVDFGLMGQFAHGNREVLEIGGLMMGTAYYAAPEQATGDLVDARADLYAFGCMLYELVTGRPPFVASGAQKVLMMHLSRPPVPPSQIVRGVPPVLESLILNLLSKHRSARLGYAEDVAEILVEAGAEPDPDFKVETAAYLYRPDIIGRKDTIEELRKKAFDLRHGIGSFSMLGGVSGIGKTSVAAALAREATLAGIEVVTAECDPVAGQPLHPLRPLLRSIAEFCRGNADMIERVLGPRLEILRDQEPSIAALAPESTVRIPPEIVARRIFDDLQTTIAAYAWERPLVLILDDLQWADEVTLRFLATLREAFFDGLPCMIVGTYRIDETGPELRALLTLPHLTKIQLARLDDASVADVARSMLAAPDAPESFLRFLADETEGNPFFLAEYLRAAVYERLLFREKGRWHIAAKEASYASLGLPGTLRDLVVRRLDRLSPVARRVAETAAVFGREVPESLLLATSGESGNDTLEAVSELIEHQFCEAIENGVRFAHDKLREGAYDRIAEDRRRELHGRAGEILESWPEREAHAAELARHFDIAGHDDKAIRYYEQAAEAALASGACRESTELMGRGLVVDERRAAKEPPKERRIRHGRWYRLLSHATFGLGDLITSAEHARTSLAQAGVNLPRSQNGWRVRLGLESLRQLGHKLVPPPMLRVRKTKQPMFRDITSALQKFSEQSYYSASPPALMLASGFAAVNAAERLGDVPALIHAYANLGSVASAIGLHKIAHHYFDQARRLATESNDLIGIGHIGYAASVEYVPTCDWDSCDRYLEAALAAARKTGDGQLIEMCLAACGFHVVHRGWLAKGEEMFFSPLREAARKRFNRQHEAFGYYGRAFCLIPMGRVERALEAIDKALVLLDGPNDFTSIVGALAVRAQALLHLERYDEALAAADTAYDTVQQSPVIIWEMYRGLTAPAEVYLAQWARTGGLDEERMRRLEHLLRRLRLVYKRLPLAEPPMYRHSAVFEILAGNARKGEKLLRRASASAVRLRLPIEEGIAEYELSRCSTIGAAERETHRQRARTVLESAECGLYLRKLSDAQGA